MPHIRLFSVPVVITPMSISSIQLPSCVRRLAYSSYCSDGVSLCGSLLGSHLGYGLALDMQRGCFWWSYLLLDEEGNGEDGDASDNGEHDDDTGLLGSPVLPLDDVADSSLAAREEGGVDGGHCDYSSQCQRRSSKAVSPVEELEGPRKGKESAHADMRKKTMRSPQ
jgi:hypothetical protein